jgi:hypothetical protein
MTQTQINYYYEHLPMVELRRHLPVAQLEAALRNIMGGKPDSDSQTKTDLSKLYSAYELLPYYARLDEFDPGITQAAARDFLENTSDLPSWVLQIAPINEIKGASRG